MVAGIEAIVELLERQRAAIENALAALRAVGGAVPAAAEPATSKKRNRPAKRRRGITPEGRERLRNAMKRRWAVKRAAAKSTVRKGGTTAEGRKRLAEAMRKRWAVKRAASKVRKRGRAKKAA